MRIVKKHQLDVLGLQETHLQDQGRSLYKGGGGTRGGGGVEALLLQIHITLPWLCSFRGVHVTLGGMFARRATFVLSILSLAPSLSSLWEIPQGDHTRPKTFSARHLV